MPTFKKVTFSAKDLKKIHPAHLGYIIAAAHACNEINAVRIYLIFEHKDIIDRPVEKAFVSIRQMVLLRHMSAKIFEFNKITVEYFGAVRKLYPAFTEKTRSKYLPIARQIRTNLWLPILRNKVAFHFDAQKYLQELSRVADNQNLSLFFGEKQGETAFSFAEEIVSMPMFHSIGQGDTRKGLLACARFANTISSSIIKFVSQHQIEVFEQYGMFHNIEALEADPKFCGRYNSDFIPIFTSENLRLKISPE